MAPSTSTPSSDPAVRASSFILIANDGQALKETNYWTHSHGEAGLFYLSAHAGALRLLVPPPQEHVLDEIRTGKNVVIEESDVMPGCWHIVFDDGSEAPFTIDLDKRQADCIMTPRRVPFFVWTQSGLQASFACEIIV